MPAGWWARRLPLALIPLAARCCLSAPTRQGIPITVDSAFYLGASWELGRVLCWHPPHARTDSSRFSRKRYTGVS